MVLSILARCRGNFIADDDIAFSDAIVNVGRIFKGNDTSKSYQQEECITLHLERRGHHLT